MSGLGFQSGAFQSNFQPGTYIVEPGPTGIAFLPASSAKTVTELSDYYAQLQFMDVNGVAYTPTAVSWRVWDETNKIQLQDWTALSNLAAVMFLDIPAAYNALGNQTNLQEWRAIIFRITAPGGAARYDRADYSVIAIPDTP